MDPTQIKTLKIPQSVLSLGEFVHCHSICRTLTLLVIGAFMDFLGVCSVLCTVNLQASSRMQCHRPFIARQLLHRLYGGWQCKMTIELRRTALWHEDMWDVDIQASSNSIYLSFVKGTLLGSLKRSRVIHVVVALHNTLARSQLPFIFHSGRENCIQRTSLFGWDDFQKV